MTIQRSLSLLACVLTTIASAQGNTYRDPPGDLNMEGKYRTLVQLAFTGQMSEAEGKARALLDVGYRGTRLECRIHDKLASGYERQGKKGKAVAAWKLAMLSSDPSKGTWVRAREKILEYGGTPPPQVAPAPAPSQTSTARIAQTPASRRHAPRPRPESRVRPRPVERGRGRSAEGLQRDPAYLSAMADLRSGSYQGVRASIKKFESLVLDPSTSSGRDRGYQGTPAEAELQGRIADAHLVLALQHYRWADAAAGDNGDDAAQRARRLAAEIEQLRNRGVASAR